MVLRLDRRTALHLINTPDADHAITEESNKHYASLKRKLGAIKTATRSLTRSRHRRVKAAVAPDVLVEVPDVVIHTRIHVARAALILRPIALLPARPLAHVVIVPTLRRGVVGAGHQGWRGYERSM